MASRSRRSSSGGGKSNRHFNSIVWFIAVAAIVFAFFQVPYDPGAKGIYEIAKSKSENVQKWVGGIAPSIEKFVGELLSGGSEKPDTSGTGGTGGTDSSTPAIPNTGTAPVSESQQKLATLTVANASNSKYDRDEWKHWKNVRSCWTTREEVLATEAVAGSLSLKDVNGNATADLASACEVVSGTWNDPYSGKTFTNPTDLDIDHMIPLNYAAQHGGQAWDSGKKADYANNLAYAGHLIAVDKGENRSKSDKGPSEWKPSNQADWCQYSTDWVSISSTWNLSVTKADSAALTEMLATCV